MAEPAAKHRIPPIERMMDVLSRLERRDDLASIRELGEVVAAPVRDRTGQVAAAVSVPFLDHPGQPEALAPRGGQGDGLPVLRGSVAI